MKFSSFFVGLFGVYCIIILNYFLNYKDMGDLGVLKHFANPNSLGEIHKKKSKKERLISIVSRNLRKIGHNEGLEDPIGDLLKELSERTGNNYNSLEDLDEVTLEGISHASVLTIHELCENVKDDTQKIIIQ